MKKFKLTIDLIPERNWNYNLAHILPRKIWDTVRREIYAKFGWRCAICGDSGQMHCHEQWIFDDRKHIQFLKGLQCLCKPCHDIRHWGRTIGMMHDGVYTSKYIEELTKHFCTVNDCSVGEFELHKVEATKAWKSRNKFNYVVVWGKFSPENIEKEWIKQRR